MFAAAPAQRLRNARTVLLVVVCAGYVISQFLRNSAGVIGPDLSSSFDLAPDDLGLLSGAFFASFAAAQIPVGMALDRFGPRLTMSVSLVFAVGGSLIFAAAESLTGLTVARIAMGLGSSVLLMGPLVLMSRWFGPKSFSTLAGVILAVGGLGTLVATAPLAWSAATFGWRATFVLAAVISGLIGIVIALLVRDAPPECDHAAPGRETVSQSLRGLTEVFRHRDVIPVFVMQLFAYSTFVSVLGLWGGPYLSDVYAMGLAERGNVLLVMAIGQVAGLFVIATLDRVFNTRKWIVVGGAAMAIVLLVVFAVFPRMPVGWLLAVFALFGFVYGFAPVLIAHGKSIFPARITGRGLSVLNTATMGGVFLVQYTSGLVIASFGQTGGMRGGAQIPVIAYQACFLSLAVMLTFALAVYSCARDRRPGEPPPD